MVSLGGAFGAAARYLVGQVTQALTNSPFPYGTLTVNTTGSFLLALLAVSVFDQGLLSQQYKLLLLTGFLGAFTTFSTFSYESLKLLTNGLHTSFILNVAGNVLLCLGGAWFGLILGQSIT
jgi:CrcB protein